MYTSILIDECENQVCVVKAIEKIQALKIISEYSGKIVLYNPKLVEFNDSLMQYGTFGNYEFVIDPSLYCNLARFISGINNYKKNSKY